MNRNDLFTVLKDNDALKSSNGTSFTSQIIRCTGLDLIRVFGEPSFASPSYDDKVRMEWVVKYSSYDENDKLINQVFTIYDWKTSDSFNLLEEEYDWHVGSKESSFYITRIFVEDVYESIVN